MKRDLSPAQSPAPDQPVLVKANPVIADPMTRRYRHMRDATMKANEPAECELSAISTRQWGQAALKNGIGSNRPPFLLPGFDDDLQNLYLIALAEKVPGAVPVSYRNGRASFNLYDAFAYANRLALPGRTELYPLEPTQGPVTMGEVSGWGLQCALSAVTSVPISALSDEEKAKRQAARARNKQKREPAQD